MMSLGLLVCAEVLGPGRAAGQRRSCESIGPPTPPVPLHRGWRGFYILIFSCCLLTDDEALAAPPVPDES